MTPQDHHPPTPADGSEPTRVLGPAGEPTPTLRLGGPTDGPVPADAPAQWSDEPSSADAEYSATVLASHWIQRPEPEDSTLVIPPAAEVRSAPSTAVTLPDRVEGTVLRFGPGVTAAVAHRTHGEMPAVPPPPYRSPRRHALPALVLICVIAFLAWQRLGPPAEVRTVAVTARPAVLGCDDTADIVGLVTTNARPGTLSYRWVRSDGTRSGVLRDVLVRGQRQTRPHLLWTFQGRGHYTARAELRILSPSPRTVTVRLRYDCP
jgi:hypothetical protein